MPPAFRAFLALLTSALLLSTPALPFDTPLSDQAVREAYFLGQRTDQKIVDFFSGYTRHLPFPKAGPYVSEIQDRKSTRLNSSHTVISYAVFCLKKKNKE